MLKKLNLILMAVFLMICTGNIFAQVYEGFNYPLNAAIAGQNGGTGWSAGWLTGGVAYIVNGLNYPGMTYATGKALGPVTNLNNPTRLLNTPILGTSGTSVRISFLLSPVSNCVITDLVLFDTTGANYVQIGCSNNKWKLHTHGGGTFYALPGSFTTNTTNYAVVQIDFKAGNDRMRLWASPLALNNLATDSISQAPILDHIFADLPDIAKVQWNSVSSNVYVSPSIDEIRIEKMPTGAAKDNFGMSVGISGSYAVVGAPQCDVFGNTNTNTGNGKAYIYQNIGGTWNLIKTLTDSSGAPGDCFGRSVAISGDYVIVGANKADIGTSQDAGKAFVFDRTFGGGWGLRKTLTASDTAANDQFGISVSIAGDYAIVGAHLAEPTGGINNQGQAYIFERNFGTGWGEKNILAATEIPVTLINNGDQFGQSVGISANGRAIVGAISHDEPYKADQGSAYIFDRQTTGQNPWTQTQKLIDSLGAIGDNFGTSVAINGNGTTAVIGAYTVDHNGKTDPGAAYIFNGSTSLSQQAKLIFPAPQSGDNLGSAVAIFNNTVVLGAYYDEIIPGSTNPVTGNQGVAYFSTRTGSIWSTPVAVTGNPTGSTITNTDLFGSSVGISGNFAIIGAPLSDVGANLDQGRVYIFKQIGSSWVQQQDLTN